MSTITVQAHPAAPAADARTRLPPQQVFRYKLVLLGHQEVGKTSLRKCFESDPMFFKKLPEVQSTTGIEVQQKSVKVGDDLLDFRISDFAGQEAYHSHSLFLTDRSVFALVWKISAVEQDFTSSGISQGEESRLCQWIAQIYSKFPSASLAIIATHLDELRDPSQRAVEFILTKVEALLRGYVRNIATKDENGEEVLMPFVGSFAVSCKTRTFIASGTHKALSGQKLSSLLAVLAQAAHRNCVSDPVFWGAAIPGRHLRLKCELEQLQRAGEKLYVTLSEYVRLAVAVGIESDKELLEVSQLFHSWGVLYMFNRNAVADNLYFFLHPSWLCRIAGILFSFAHVLATPQHMRSVIQGIEYRVTPAEQADLGLLGAGYLRLPLVRVLYFNALRTFFNREPDDRDYNTCLGLLQALELATRVHVPCADPDIATCETGIAPPPPPGYTVRYFVPSLSPYCVPPTLRAVAPALFLHGAHVKYEFNMIPQEMWFRLLLRLIPHTKHLSIPTLTEQEAEEDFSLPEASEMHTLWRDGLWLQAEGARMLLMREEDAAVRMFTASIKEGAELPLLDVVEKAASSVCCDYLGVNRRIVALKSDGWQEVPKTSVTTHPPAVSASETDAADGLMREALDEQEYQAIKSHQGRGRVHVDAQTLVAALDKVVQAAMAKHLPSR